MRLNEQILVGVSAILLSIMVPVLTKDATISVLLFPIGLIQIYDEITSNK